MKQTFNILQGRLWPVCRGRFAMMLLALAWGMILPLPAQKLFQRFDSLLTNNYHKVNFDTVYITRPQTKWTVMARVNVSGATIETEGIDNGQHFKSQMDANSKATLSLGLGYQGFSLSLALNPAKLMGKYNDYELNFNCYRRNFGFDVIYQDAKNFTGWYDQGGMPRAELPDGKLQVQTLNLNAYYAFNNSKFSYPAAFSQNYIQRRSAGSFLLAASGMGQRATLDMEQEQKLQLKMTNIGIGAGYGYNYVPHKGWLMHLSLLPTFIVYSNSSMTYEDICTAQHYHFPEFIVTGRGAVVRHWRNKFLGLSMVYNYTNIGDKGDLAVYNTKWRIRAFFGLRI
ncbi:MAG: DUF4421 family protein [Prevotella sp.]|nr:DUF4421 family protein [Prevotella sp.]